MVDMVEKFLKPVKLFDNGLRCFRTPCFNIEVRQPDGAIVALVSDVLISLNLQSKGARLNEVFQLDGNTSVSGFIIDYQEPSTSDEHKAIVVTEVFD